MSGRDQAEKEEKAALIAAAAATLEREADEWEARAAKLREAAGILRDAVSVTRAEAITATPTPATEVAETRAPSAPSRTLPLPGPRTPTSALILDALEAKPGLQFEELAEMVIPKIESTASNKRKLVRSTVDYLKTKSRIFTYPNGGMYVSFQKDLSDAVDDLKKALDGLNDKTRAD
jgi:hypothetical protein